MNSGVNKTIDTVGSMITPVLDNKLIILVVSMLFIYSAIDTLDSLPVPVTDVIMHPVTKAALLFVTVYLTTKDVMTSLVAVIAVVIMYRLSFLIKEKFEIITITPDVYPGCVKATVADLLGLFNGDTHALKKSMYDIGVPLNLPLTNDNAPKIATYFINHGKKITESCRQPM